MMTRHRPATLAFTKANATTIDHLKPAMIVMIVIFVIQSSKQKSLLREPQNLHQMQKATMIARAYMPNLSLRMLIMLGRIVCSIPFPTTTTIKPFSA
jgi:hypothetical protein